MGNKGKTPRDIRQANHELIFRLLRENRAMSCTELAKEIRLSNTAVEKITDSLYQKGFISLCGDSYPKVKGRRPIRYSLNKDAGAYIEINFTDGAYSVRDFCGSELTGGAFTVEKGADEVGLRTVFEQINSDAVKAAGSIISVSASLVGKADTKTGEIAESRLFKKGVNLGKILEACFNVPVSVTNDTYLALISELEQTKTDNAVYVYIGKGVSCAFIIDGKIYTGGGGLAGEIGQVTAHGGTIESLLSFNRLAALDEAAKNTDGGSDIADVVPLIDALTLTAKILDLNEIIVSCPFTHLRGYIIKRLNSALAKTGALNSRATLSKSANISEGLHLNALFFCHNVVIRHVLRP